jgi:hypothetical protein
MIPLKFNYVFTEITIIFFSISMKSINSTQLYLIILFLTLIQFIIYILIYPLNQYLFIVPSPKIM